MVACSDAETVNNNARNKEVACSDAETVNNNVRRQDGGLFKRRDCQQCEETKRRWLIQMQRLSTIM